MASAAVSVGVGAAFNGVGKITETVNAAGKTVKVVEKDGLSKMLAGKLGDGFGQVALDAGLAGLQTGITTVANTAINSLQIQDGRLAFNGESFTESMSSAGTWASTVAGMASTFTAGALGQVNLMAPDKDALNTNTFNTEGIQKLNSFTGSLAGGAVTYGLSGEVTLNMAKYGEVGLLELNISKENGVSVGLGMGGIDVSLGTIAGAISGLGDSTKIMGINLFGGEEEKATLSTINKLGYSSNDYNRELALAVWNDEREVRYKELGYENGKKILGKFDHNNGDEILLDSGLLGGGREGSVTRAAVMSHENTHLLENRYEGIAHMYGLGTYNELNTMFGLEADSGLYNSMLYGIEPRKLGREYRGCGSLDADERRRIF